MLKLFAFCVELPTCWNNPWWAARCPFHQGRLLKRTVPPCGTSTMNSSLLTSKTFGFFTLIPCKQHQLELSSTQGPREHRSELSAPGPWWKSSCFSSRRKLFPNLGSFSSNMSSAEIVTLGSFCTLAAQHHPGSNHHREPGNGPFTLGWASRRCCFVLPNLRGVFLPEKCTTFRYRAGYITFLKLTWVHAKMQWKGFISYSVTHSKKLPVLTPRAACHNNLITPKQALISTKYLQESS